MARLALKLFGSYRLTLDGHPIESSESDKGRAMLAFLAVDCEHAHSREKMIGIFWPEQDEEHARGSLSQALYHLRGTLGDRPLTGSLPAVPTTGSREPYLLVTPHEIQLNPNSDFDTDVSAFTSLVAACKAHVHPMHQTCAECLERYQKAARLYAGDFLDGFYLPKSVAFEEWATIQREQLHLEMMVVLEHLVMVFEQQGELDQALAYAHKMVQLDELGEAGNQHLLRLLALLDRQAEALAQYASFHHTLAVQLGAEPGKETKLLYQRLRNEEAGEQLGSLPANLTSFIGRRQELAELWSLLRDPNSRLICILGLGGCGKTHLALEAARKQRYYFRDGVYFIHLSALGAGSSLLAVVAERLGFTFREVGDPKGQLLNFLSNKKVLLILDSFETVLDSAGLVAEILSASEGSKVLVTSRVRLNISGEYVYPLEGMQVPPHHAKRSIIEYSSVDLFLEAARRMKPGYMPDRLEDVARICRLAEGMPLSLLLASSWVSDHSAREIADQISHSLDFLAVEWADMPERQRSLRATFEYSWKLLSSCEQEVLMSLAVFHSPFSTQAAYPVAGASAQLLHALAGKSLLRSISERRYLMHDLVRQYSAEKLALAQVAVKRAAHQQHRDYFLERVAGWSKEFKSVNQSAALLDADKEIEDVQAAWEWTAQQAEIDKLVRALEGLLLYYSLRYRYQEGERACQVALEGIKSVSTGGKRLNLEGWLLVWQAYFCRLIGNRDMARQLLDEGWQKLEQADTAGQDTRSGKAIYWWQLGRFESSLPKQLDCFRQSAELFQKLGDPWRQAGILASMGSLHNFLGDYKQCVELHQQSLALSRACGEPLQIAAILDVLAIDEMFYGSWETGVRLSEEAVSLYRSVGGLGRQANVESTIAFTFGWSGRYPEACEMFELFLEKLHQSDDRYGYATGIGGLGTAQMHSGRYTQAATTLGKALEVLRQEGIWRWEAFCLAQMGCLALLEKEASSAIALLQQSAINYRQMGFTGELGTALGGLALVQHMQGLEEQAWASLNEALCIAVSIHGRITLLTLAAALIVMLADSSRWEHAVEAYYAVMTDPIVANSRWFVDMIGNRIELARDHLPKEVFLAAEKRGRTSDPFDVFGKLAQEIKSWDANLLVSTLN